MLPAYIPNPVAALCGGGTPVDLGKTWSDGRRIFGDGKTYRGLLAGILAGIASGLFLIWLSASWHLTVMPEQTVLSVVLLACGALLGDLAKSFFKRRFGRERGAKWPVADQYDLVVGAFLLLLVFDSSWIFSRVTLAVLAFILVLTPLLHRSVNIIGYLLKVKEVPW